MPTRQSSSSTSLSLLDRVKEFDADAWDRFTKLYGPIVYRWCRQAGLQDNDAADVSQEVFRAVANGIGSFRREEPGSSFRGWLWTITRNKLRDYFQWLSSRPSAVGGTDANQQLQSIPDSPPDEEHSSDSDLTAGLAHRALELVRDEFETRTWQAFLRVAIGGQNPAVVAEELGMKVGAVYTAKSRVLRRLREEIEGLI
ncbi:MAG: sigma-70 family RNA polymerase sigma factor [Planctomycetes bacterium]|nr:sigma-70 family RNA polymerase sigma factor [Planctomycetota bacterium]